MYKRPLNWIHGPYEFALYTSTTWLRASHSNQRCSNGHLFQCDCSPPWHVANLTAGGSAYQYCAARRSLMLRLLYNFKACKTNKMLWPAGVATCQGICINGREFFMAKDLTIQLQSNGGVHHATTTGHKLHSILRQLCFQFVLFIYSSWFYVSNFSSKRTVNSIQHIE